MGDEVHIVTRQESFNDFAVRELAQSKAACMCRVQFKRCKMSKCASCDRHKRIKNCEGAMSDYDLERLRHYTSVYYREYSYNPMTWMSHKEYKRYYFRYVLLVILFVALIGLIPFIMMGPFDQVSKDIDYNSAIVNVIQVAQSQVYDVNKDSKVNCVDYAIVFKLVWDQKYPRLKDECTIVRNKNWFTDMHHLFICVHNIYVEPGTYDPYDYTMESVWGDRYDPTCNKYGETRYWLGEVKE